MPSFFILMTTPIFGHAHFFTLNAPVKIWKIIFLNLGITWYIKIGVFEDEKHDAIVCFAHKCSRDNLSWLRPLFYPVRTDKNVKNMYPNLYTMWYIEMGVFEDEKHNAIVCFAQKCSRDNLSWPRPLFYPVWSDKNVKNICPNLYTMWYIVIGVFEDENHDAISNFAQKCSGNKLWWPRLLFTFSAHMKMWKNANEHIIPISASEGRSSEWIFSLKWLNLRIIDIRHLLFIFPWWKLGTIFALDFLYSRHRFSPLFFAIFSIHYFPQKSMAKMAMTPRPHLPIANTHDCKILCFGIFWL